MNNQEVKDLLNRYHQDQCTPQEKALVETWYLNLPADTLQDPIDELRKDLDEIEHRLMAHAAPVKIRLWPRIAAAAAVLIVIGGGLFYFQPRNHEHLTANVYKNDVAPGGNKALLTLADGSKISLDEAANHQLATQSGTKITKTAAGQLVYETADQTQASGAASSLNTISTPRGGQYLVTLADGTKVWLNASSSLTYPSGFANTRQRRVTLKGEAYFEVAKDKLHPFVVETDKQTVKVLGTHFNISSYEDDRTTKTTLLEGLVSVNAIGKEEQIIHPGQQAVLNANAITVKEANTEEAMAWKNGYFRFNDEDIKSVMRKLSRWYNIDIQYEGEVSTEGFTGKISRFKPISEVLNALESTKTIHFKVEGRRVTVIK